MLGKILGCVMLLIASATLHAAVQLDIQPNPIVAGQSFNIAFTLTGEADVEPDFSPLDQSVEIVGRNRQTSIALVNGVREQKTTWVLSGIARVSDKVEIAAIRFGSQSSPARTVQIVEAPTVQNASGADIILEVEVDGRTPYVQQQVIYTIRLLHRVELSSPRFSMLETNTDAIVKALGDGRQYRHVVAGTNYEAFEQRYAIFPQKSGAVRIAPLVLTTQVIARKRAFFDPFSQSLQTRRVESEAIDLVVKPMPDSYPKGATWLPASKLRLHEEWMPNVATTDVGTPLTRTLFLWAEGLVAGQLPEIKLEPPAGIKLYPDQAQSEEKDVQSGFTAIMQQKFALIAGVPGRASFAAIALPWWNTTTDQLEMAEIPAREFEFIGAESTPLSAAPKATASPSPVANARAAAPAATTDQRWKLIAVAAVCGWILTLTLWFYRSQQNSAARSIEDHARSATEAAPQTTKNAVRALKSACAANQPAAAAAALLAWSRSARQSNSRSLRDVASTARFDDFARAIHALEQHLYGPNHTPWSGKHLWDAFRREPAQTESQTQARQQPLPALFRLARK